MAQNSISAKSFNEIIFNIKMQLKSKGQNSTKALLRKFYESDRDQNGYLDREEFEELLSSSGIFLGKIDVNYLVRALDRNNDNRLSFQEFFDGIVPPLTVRRQSTVASVYAKLDPSSNGAVTMNFIFSNFNVKNHPDVVTGQKLEQEIMGKFLDVFDAMSRGESGLVTYNEFFNCYREISASFPYDDEAFVRMMRCVWGLDSVEVPACAGVDTLEVLMRDKARLKARGAESEEKVLLRMFKFVDMDENGVLTPSEFKEALRRIGVNLNDEQVAEFFRKYDSDCSGTLDYNEFCSGLMNFNAHIHSTSLSRSFYAK